MRTLYPDKSAFTMRRLSHGSDKGHLIKSYEKYKLHARKKSV
jgi:hypothetical protein